MEISSSGVAWNWFLGVFVGSVSLILVQKSIATSGVVNSTKLQPTWQIHYQVRNLNHYIKQDKRCFVCRNMFNRMIVLHVVLNEQDVYLQDQSKQQEEKHPIGMKPTTLTTHA